jgi:hypothetical protein
MSREENRFWRDVRIARGVRIFSLKKSKRLANDDDNQWVQYKAHQYADTRTSCSCWMCGNPRRYSKGKEALTRAEIVADISYREMREEES